VSSTHIDVMNIYDRIVTGEGTIGETRLFPATVDLHQALLF